MKLKPLTVLPDCMMDGADPCLAYTGLRAENAALLADNERLAAALELTMQCASEAGVLSDIPVPEIRAALDAHNRSKSDAD